MANILRMKIDLPRPSDGTPCVADPDGPRSNEVLRNLNVPPTRDFVGYTSSAVDYNGRWAITIPDGFGFRPEHLSDVTGREYYVWCQKQIIPSLVSTSSSGIFSYAEGKTSAIDRDLKTASVDRTEFRDFIAKFFDIESYSESQIKEWWPKMRQLQQCLKSPVLSFEEFSNTRKKQNLNTIQQFLSARREWYQTLMAAVKSNPAALTSLANELVYASSGAFFPIDSHIRYAEEGLVIEAHTTRQINQQAENAANAELTGTLVSNVAAAGGKLVAFTAAKPIDWVLGSRSASSLADGAIDAVASIIGSLTRATMSYYLSEDPGLNPVQRSGFVTGQEGIDARKKWLETDAAVNFFQSVADGLRTVGEKVEDEAIVSTDDRLLDFRISMLSEGFCFSEEDTLKILRSEKLDDVGSRACAPIALARVPANLLSMPLPLDQTLCPVGTFGYTGGVIHRGLVSYKPMELAPDATLVPTCGRSMTIPHMLSAAKERDNRFNVGTPVRNASLVKMGHSPLAALHRSNTVAGGCLPFLAYGIAQVEGAVSSTIERSSLDADSLFRPQQVSSSAGDKTTFRSFGQALVNYIDWTLLPGCFPVIGGGGSGKSFFATNLVNAINAEANVPSLPVIPTEWTPSGTRDFLALSVTDTSWGAGHEPIFAPDLEMLKNASVVRMAERSLLAQYVAKSKTRAFYFELNEPVGSSAATRLQDILAVIGSGVFDGCAVIIDSIRLQALLGNQLMSGGVPRDSIIGPMTPLTTLGQRTNTTIIPFVNLASAEKLDDDRTEEGYRNRNYSTSVSVGGALELSSSGLIALHSAKQGIISGSFASRLSNGLRLSASKALLRPAPVASSFHFGTVPSFYLR